ncbi:Uncharacterised protein [Enterobacter cloacae]|nr:Uncharacterised protein [Enterobacter cloacae]
MEDCQEWSESSAAVLTLSPWERAPDRTNVS